MKQNMNKYIQIAENTHK